MTDAWAPGDERHLLADFPPLNNHIADGSLAFPITAVGSTFRLSRTERYATVQASGNNEVNAGILATTMGLYGTTMQTIAILGQSISYGMNTADFNAYSAAHPGASANNDAVGIGGIGVSQPGSRGGGAGVYGLGIRNDATGSCSAMEASVRNGVATVGQIFSNGPSDVTGVVATIAGSANGGDAFVSHSADGGTTRWRVAFHATTQGATDAAFRDDSNATIALQVNGSHTIGLDFSGSSAATALIRATGAKTLLNASGDLDVSCVPANLLTTRILNYVANTDVIATTVAASTPTDICPSQSFTLADASSTVEFFVRGMVQINCAALETVVVTMVIDAAGTPQTFKIAGNQIAASGWGNALAGVAPVVVTGLTAGAHTVKLQIQCQQSTVVNCRANTQGTWEHLAIQAVEVRR